VASGAAILRSWPVTVVRRSGGRGVRVKGVRGVKYPQLMVNERECFFLQVANPELLAGSLLPHWRQKEGKLHSEPAAEQKPVQ